MKEIDQMLDQWIHNSIIKAKLRELITKEINNMKKKWITVLDYETARVYQYQVTINKHAEEYITFKGHRLSNVEWMEHQFHSIITK